MLWYTLLIALGAVLSGWLARICERMQAEPPQSSP